MRFLAHTPGLVLLACIFLTAAGASCSALWLGLLALAATTQAGVLYRHYRA